MKGIILLLVTLLGVAALSQPPPPPHPGRPLPNIEERLTELRRKIARQPAADVSAQRALQYSKRYLDAAQKAIHSGQTPQADRLAAAAEALLHVAEHQEHLKGGDGRPEPRPEMIKDHLERVYFRTEQSEYFVSQAHDATAAALDKWARDFYQLALREYDRKQWVAADENAKCADAIMDALESLAQAANLTGGPPPPPRTPAPPRP